jgi:hypothetical protein
MSAVIASRRAGGAACSRQPTAGINPWVANHESASEKCKAALSPYATHDVDLENRDWPSSPQDMGNIGALAESQGDFEDLVNMQSSAVGT